MISGLTGTGTENFNWPGPGLRLSIYRDRDQQSNFTGKAGMTGMTGTKTSILILEAATFIYIIIEQFE